jgi:Protein of unknown function (DUF2924)
VPRVRVSPAPPDREQLVVEIARLRDLDVGQLRNRWRAVFGRRAPTHLPRHVLLIADGFAWNGKTYPSLSQVAFAITGIRWNGPRFFGLRDKPQKAGSA